MITFRKLGYYGQLGNQMFQWALLQAIQAKSGFEVVMHEQVIKDCYLFRFFELQRYKVNNIELTPYIERTFEYYDDVFNIDGVSFEGHYQSDKYFREYRDIILSEFTFKDEIVQKANSIIDEFKGKNLVAIHVRRGDYLNYPDYHPLPTMDYYNKAMSYFNDENTHFLCFSNDIEWCKENFKIENISIIGNSLEIDLCAMSMCHHHIIANSSYSWWSSYLCKNESKKVIAPRRWFGLAANINFSDIYRDEFILL